MLETNYTTRQAVKDWLKVTVADDDGAIDSLLAPVSRGIDRFCGRPFGSEAGTTRTFDGTGRRYLDVYPDLQSITALTVAPYEGQAGVPIVAPYFFLEPQEREFGWPSEQVQLSILSPWTIFTRGKRTVSITGDWGWAAVPADVELAARLWIARLLKKRDAGDETNTSGESKTGTVPRGGSWQPPEDVRPLLVPLKRRQAQYASSGDNARSGMLA